MQTKYVAILAVGLWMGCVAGEPMESGADASPPDGPGTTIDPNELIPPTDEDGCHGIYAQDHVPTFELTIAPEEWDALYDEWLHGAENEELYEQGLIDDYHPYHPVAEFRYGDVVITDAAVRLRGNPTYWRPQNKLQLQVSFHKYRKGGRFLGLKKVLFDAASANQNFLRDRISLALMRDLGIPAPCANHARVFINGEYYGLFTNIEKIDKLFLKRNFPEAPTGDLWKRANWKLKTNEDTSDDTRLDALRDASTVAELDALMDIEQAIMLWAVDAVIPNSDGIWAGGLNFYLYDDPTRGEFVVLPWDLDNTFTRLSYDVDPYTWHKPERFHGRPWYDLALQDPVWFKAYINAIDKVLEEGYVVSRMEDRIARWTEQIQDAVFADPNKPFSNRKYLEEVEELRQYINNRADFVDQWLSCWQSGGVDDGTGHCVPAN